MECLATSHPLVSGLVLVLVPVLVLLMDNFLDMETDLMMCLVLLPDLC